jgi:hypothetical protein
MTNTTKNESPNMSKAVEAIKASGRKGHAAYKIAHSILSPDGLGNNGLVMRLCNVAYRQATGRWYFPNSR